MRDTINTRTTRSSVSQGMRVGVAAIALLLLSYPTLAIEPADLQRLDASAVTQHLQDLPGWTTDGAQLACTYQFDNFVEAIAFVDRLVAPAEAAQHHPDITVSYNKVTLSLTTHDAGGLTRQDFELAEAISRLGSSSEPLTCLPADSI